jgi:hypothetical protein
MSLNSFRDGLGRITTTPAGKAGIDQAEDQNSADGE